MTSLFIIAHPDDEAFGPAGIITQLSRWGESVLVACLCNGARPGAEQVATWRQSAFKTSCMLMGVDSIQFNHPDVHLDARAAAVDIEMLINQYQPTSVYTHSTGDLHHDHRTVAQATLTACRPHPTSSVRALYSFELPGSTEWSFGQMQTTFMPNVFVDIEDVLNVRKDVLSLYTTELHVPPDARSIDGVVTLARQRGRQSGVTYAEALQLIYARDHKIL